MQIPPAHEIPDSPALTHPYLAHSWAKHGADLRVPAPGQASKRSLLDVLDHVGNELIAHISATKRSTDFIALLGLIDAAYGAAARSPEQAGLLSLAFPAVGIQGPLGHIDSNRRCRHARSAARAVAASPTTVVPMVPV